MSDQFSLISHVMSDLLRLVSHVMSDLVSLVSFPLSMDGNRYQFLRPAYQVFQEVIFIFRTDNDFLEAQIPIFKGYFEYH